MQILVCVMDGARWEFLFMGGCVFILWLTCLYFHQKCYCQETFYHISRYNGIKNEAKKASPFGRGGGVADGEGKNSPLTRYRGSSPRGRALRYVQLYGCGFFVISDMLYCEKVTLFVKGTCGAAWDSLLFRENFYLHTTM